MTEDNYVCLRYISRVGQTLEILSASCRAFMWTQHLSVLHNFIILTDLPTWRCRATKNFFFFSSVEKKTGYENTS